VLGCEALTWCGGLVGSGGLVVWSGGPVVWSALVVVWWWSLVVWSGDGVWWSGLVVSGGVWCRHALRENRKLPYLPDARSPTVRTRPENPKASKIYR
jgi:hypothetical protein